MVLDGALYTLHNADIIIMIVHFRSYNAILGISLSCRF